MIRLLNKTHHRYVYYYLLFFTVHMLIDYINCSIYKHHLYKHKIELLNDFTFLKLDWKEISVNCIVFMPGIFFVESPAPSWCNLLDNFRNWINSIPITHVLSSIKHLCGRIKYQGQLLVRLILLKSKLFHPLMHFKNLTCVFITHLCSIILTVGNSFFHATLLYILLIQNVEYILI